MKCPTCSYELENGTRVCTETDYRILKSNGVLDRAVFNNPIEHDIESGDEEIGDTTNIKYCVCGFWMDR